MVGDNFHVDLGNHVTSYRFKVPKISHMLVAILKIYEGIVSNSCISFFMDFVMYWYSLCRVALEFLREIRLKAQTDMDASREQGQSVFGLGVVFVNEATAKNVTRSEAQCMVDEITSIVSSDDERPLPLHIAGLQDVFNDDDLCTATGEKIIK